MSYRLFTLILIAAAFVAAGCSKRVEKRFPGGDPYPVTAEIEGIAGNPQGLLDEEARPARRVVLPRNASEKDGLVLTVQPTSVVHTAGSPLRVTMILRNTTRNTARLLYNTSQIYDLFVFPTEDSSNPVYAWSEYQYFERRFQEFALGPGSSQRRILEIPTTANPTVRMLAGNDLGAPLTPGVYYLWGVHEGNFFLATGPIRIEIVAPGAEPTPAEDP